MCPPRVTPRTPPAGEKDGDRSSSASSNRGVPRIWTVWYTSVRVLWLACRIVGIWIGIPLQALAPHPSDNSNTDDNNNNNNNIINNINNNINNNLSGLTCKYFVAWNLGQR